MKNKLIIGLLLILQVSKTQTHAPQTEAQRDMKEKWFAYVASQLSPEQQAEYKKVTANRDSNRTAFYEFWEKVMKPEMYKIWAAEAETHLTEEKTVKNETAPKSESSLKAEYNAYVKNAEAQNKISTAKGATPFQILSKAEWINYGKPQGNPY